MNANQDSISNGLNQLQSDYQVLYQKLRTYHWYVTGPLFFGLHEQFEKLYNEAAERVDELAERNLAMGGRPVPTLAEQLSLSRLREDKGDVPAEQMVRNLCTDYEQLNDQLRKLARQAADLEDVATANMLDNIADAQEKTVWMLRAFTARKAA